MGLLGFGEVVAGIAGCDHLPQEVEVVVLSSLSLAAIAYIAAFLHMTRNEKLRLLQLMQIQSPILSAGMLLLVLWL